MKLNFSNDDLGAQESFDSNGGNPFANNMMNGNPDSAIILNDFPSLRDLETSNLHTNRFTGERAARYALQAISDEGQRAQML